MGKLVHDGETVSVIQKGLMPAELITKSITDNGTYLASDDDADGYSSVTVNVGASKLTKLIDWELYSHPSAFDSIPLPATYSDYTHILLAAKQVAGITTWLEPMLSDAFDYYLINNTLPDNVFAIVDTSTITASDKTIYVPILGALGTSTFTFGTWGTTVMNSSRILGTNYNWGWQNLYLVCYGVNISS